MRWDIAAVAAGAGWATSALLVGAEAGGHVSPRVEAIRHLTLAVAAAATVVVKIEKMRHLDDLVFQAGRDVGRLECVQDGGCPTNVVPLHARGA